MFANAIKYKLFILRRERVISAIWFLSLVGAAIMFDAIYPGLFPTKEALLSMSTALNTPAMVAMMGPVYGLDAITPAIAMAQECLIWFAITVIVMNIFFVNRHTRVDEELGRHEMLISLPVGRLTGGLMTLVFAFGLNLLISLFSALAIIGINIEGTTTAGAFCYAFSIGAQGFLFAAITLLMAQLFSTARGSMGASFGLMGLFYLLRASGDMSGNALSYISPLGLGLKVEAFYTDAFWPVLVLFGEAVVVGVVALIVNSRRDVGAGVIPARAGKAHASRFLQSPFGLAWRLSRNSFIIWAAVMLVLGGSYGSVIGDMDNFVKSNDTIRKLLEATGGGSGSYVEAFVPYLFCIMALIISIPVIGTINKLRAEEKRNRLEQIFARSVSRGAMFWSYVVIALAEAVLYIFFAATTLYASVASMDIISAETVFGAAFAFLPAVLVFAGLSALLVGLFPKLTSLVWALFGYSFIMMYFGRLFDIPEWATRISPFGNVPQIPVEDFAATPVIVLCAIAAVLCGAGLAYYRRRDIG